MSRISSYYGDKEVFLLEVESPLLLNFEENFVICCRRSRSEVSDSSVL